MKKLFLFARNFPYGDNEAYLETEILHYDKFEEVYIFSLSVLPNQKIRNLDTPDNIKIYQVPFVSKINYIRTGLIFLFDRLFYKEIILMFKKRKLSVNSVISLLIFLARTRLESNYIRKIVARDNLISNDDELYLYSYRFDYSAMLAATLFEAKKNIYRISRAHGIDLYEYRNKHNYLPMREYILDNLDYLYLISREGLKYVKKEYPDYSSKFEICYLGTSEIKANINLQSKKFHIVSCSNVIDIKRVPLIYRALQELEFDIEWTHYGTGSDFQKLQNLTQNSREGLTINLLGQVSNQQILEDYQKLYYDLFVNVSLTEGLPVSIMEAFSGGIPAIGTNVGGTSEIINNGVNGFLLPKDLNTKMLAEKIKKYNDLEDDRKKEFRLEALKTWEENFNSGKNYKKFIEKVLNIQKSDVKER